MQDRLPLLFPVPDGIPPSPKEHYRSAYCYLGYDDLLDPTVLAQLTEFEVALRLIDLAPLPHYLASYAYKQSPKGQTPFDPVSMFLCVCWRRELHCGWRKLAKLLAGEHGAGWRRRFGFQEGVTPSASGLRHFFNAVGKELFDELCPLFTDLLHHTHLLPEHSAFPGDSPQRGLSISHVLMLHDAHSNMHCTKVTATCYQPIPRPCPAKEADQEGCDCSSPHCAQA